MDIRRMKKMLIDSYQCKLNVKSKWYNNDLNDYKDNLDMCSDNRIIEMYNNTLALNSESVENLVTKEVNKMVDAGMFNLNK